MGTPACFAAAGSARIEGAGITEDGLPLAIPGIIIGRCTVATCRDLCRWYFFDIWRQVLGRAAICVDPAAAKQAVVLICVRPLRRLNLKDLRPIRRPHLRRSAINKIANGGVIFWARCAAAGVATGRDRTCGG